MLSYRARGGVALTALSAATVAATVSAASAGVAQTAPLGLANPVAVITGGQSINATETRYQIKGTDLGIMWTDERGQILAAFGDTFGSNWTGPDSQSTNPAGIDWRSNVLAHSRDRNPSDGLSFDFVTDHPSHAKELLPSLKKNGVEMTKIPTGGVNVGGRDYMAYMSVRKFTQPGEWITNHSGVAVSDDGGQTWKDVPSTHRPNTAALDEKFQMIAYARGDGFVYAFSTPNGRFGSAYIARVPEQRLLDNSAYEYWTGERWQQGDSTVAAPIVPGPVGELSVRYDKTLKSWQMMTMDEGRSAIVVRLASQPTGPWSEPITVATAKEYPHLYGGFLHPDSKGRDIYFTMTRYDLYNVSMMHAKLPANVVKSTQPR